MVRSLLMLLLCLGGCSTYELQAPEPGEEEWKPSAPLPLQAAASAEGGGLYRRDYMFTLFQDRRADRGGDILTVMLDERTQSSKQAGTTTGKSSNISVVAPTIGTTTHNPFFYVNSALISRSQVFEFKKLSDKDVIIILKKALAEL